MLTGFFCTAVLAACTGLSHQTLVQPQAFIPQCPTAYVFPVTRRGIRVGSYVDDTDPREDADQACATAAGLGPVYAGEFGLDSGKPHGLLEFYPVLDHHSSVGTPPPSGKAGYILQSFSWGDNLTDGISQGRCTPADTQASCAAKYQAPSRIQLRQMWCRAIAEKPHVVLWYDAGGEPVGWIIRIMRKPCR